MEGEPQQPSGRPSGLPRLSKLPVQSKLPMPRNSLVRPTPSQESLTTGPLRNSKLRPTASRDQLAPSRAAQPNASNLRPPTQQGPTNRLSLSRSVGNLKAPQRSVKHGSIHKPGAMGPPPSYTGTTGGTIGRSSGLRKPIGLPATTTASAKTADKINEESDIEKPRDPPVETTEDEWGSNAVKPFSLKPRLSLSERTMQTLAEIPSSPALKSKGSVFFETESAKKRPSSRSASSRPGSSHRPGSSSRPGSSAGGSFSFRPSSRSNSRPSSSSGQEDGPPNFRASTNTYRNPLTTIQGTPSRGRLSIGSFQTPLSKTPLGGTTTRVSGTRKSPGNSLMSRSKTPSPERPAPAQATPSLKYGAKTLAARPTKARAPVTGLLKKPSLPSLNKSGASDTPRKVSSASHTSSATSRSGTFRSGASVTSDTNTTMTAESTVSPAAATARKSSAALREQIAKAKAAKRAAAVSRQASMSLDISEQVVTSGQVPASPLVPTDTSFDFGLSIDTKNPFNQHRDDGSKMKILQSRLATARTSGRLNIAAMELKEIPAEVMNMYNFESSGGEWAESVDLTRFVAADNELEMISDDIFPDRDAQDMADDEDSQGNIFAGLEALDLHGNMLITLPMGLRRLTMLTSLNLSQNRLSNNCLEVLSQVTTLKDLKLGGNLLYGPLDPSFSNLRNLEIVDLHGNNISSLPSSFGNLSRLRILNVNENCFETLPFDILSTMPLSELSAHKNQLSGTLVADAVEAFSSLQTLDVSANQLTQLTSPSRATPLAMPSLHQLSISMNRLQGLPDMSSWTNLLTLSADENSINAIPEGFTQLEKLRSVNFSSNDIRVIPAEICRMTNLAMLQLSANPLREKKFSSISTEDLKNILASRLEPVPDRFSEVVSNPGSDETVIPYTAGAGNYDDQYDSRSDLDDFATPPTSAPQSPARPRSHTASSQTWSVKGNGVLDRSSTESSALHPVVCSKIAASTAIRDVQLHHNLFTTLPESLSFFTDTLTYLSLSHNRLEGESYLTVTLDLPALKELHLSSNHITSLVPLTAHLTAPSLEKLDVSLNRISSLPTNTTLKTSFPSLSMLMIRNNHLIELDPEAIRGLRVVDAAANDIAHLNPRIGLLGGAGGLEQLDVSGNRFKVPRYNVLERGTEATLRWLRGRVPVAEAGAWKERNGVVDEGDMD